MKNFFRNIDMLHGSLWDKIILFAIPLALTNVLQQLFNTADVAVLGHFVGKEAMASVGSMTPVISIFVALFMGLGLGANVVIAQHVGAGEKKRMREAANTSLVLAVILGIAALFLVWPFAREILQLLEVPKAIVRDSTIYLQCYALGLPAMALYNFFAAMLRSIGNTTSPLVSLALASILNIALNLLLTLCFDMGVFGVAIATTFANWLSAFYLLIIVFRAREFGLHLLPRTSRRELSYMMRIGLPAAIQGMVFCFSNVIVQAAINSLGENIIAGSAAAFTIEINLYCLMSAFAQAATTFVSQNFGARNIPRCLRVTRVTLALTMPLNIACSLLIIAIAPVLLGFFTADPSVLDMAELRLWYIVLPNVITIFIDLLSGALRGYGCSLPPAIATLVAICGIRIVWVFTVFQITPTFSCLLASYPLSWFAAALLISFVYYRFRRSPLFAAAKKDGESEGR